MCLVRVQTEICLAISISFDPLKITRTSLAPATYLSSGCTQINPQLPPCLHPGIPYDHVFIEM